MFEIFLVPIFCIMLAAMLFMLVKLLCFILLALYVLNCPPEMPECAYGRKWRSYRW